MARMFHVLLLSVACCTAALGCAKSAAPRGNSSETHFLSTCGDAGECGEALACVCGVCTATCGDGTPACHRFAEGAGCAAPSDGACEESMVCDVECDGDGDCAELSEAHACEQGRCRARASSAEPDAGTSPCAASDCEYDGVCHPDGSGPIPAQDGCNSCNCEAGALLCTEIGCNAEPPVTGFRSCSVNGRLYAHGDEVPSNDCNSCTCGDGDVACTDIACDPTCDPDQCLLDGVCYPPGETTEDGCCTCDALGDGTASCIEPGWCVFPPSIGKRCDTAGDCTMGLECRTNFSGERGGVCTRPCNFGCPTGSDCVDEIQLHSDGTLPDLPGVLRNYCMRDCTAQADCDGEFGTECTDLLGQLDARYCF